MNLARLLHSLPPVHGFALDGEQVLYGRLSRSRDRLLAAARQVLPAGWFELGPVGVLRVDRTALEAGLAALLAQLEAVPAKANLLLPNCWVRSFVAEVGELPRGRVEAEEVVRWKLKKLLPCRPEEARLDFVPLPEEGRVWVLLALEKPLAVVEEVFAAKGIATGRVEPMGVALATLLPEGSEPKLLVCLDERTFVVVLVREGAVRLVRHKLLPGGAEASRGLVVRELEATLAHAREREGLAGPLAVMLATALEALRDAVVAWAQGQEGVVVHPLALTDHRLAELDRANPLAAWAILAAGAGVVG
jgi:hypothetical protein